MMTMKKAILCMMIAGTLTACGVKPSNTQPPSGAEGLYPATYPYPDKQQLKYDTEMGKIQAQKEEAIKASKAAEEAAKNKPDWSVR